MTVPTWLTNLAIASLVAAGLSAGQRVVTDGLDRLSDGATIKPAAARPPAASGASGASAVSGAGGAASGMRGASGAHAHHAHGASGASGVSAAASQAS